ncbi:MAG: hypothetical protein II005_11135 [Turicibacter sp.]|nr:hypothetical protein [Turicibacter sp.]
MANIKDEYTSNLGKDFAPPNNIEVVDIDENKFESVLDDEQYYVNIFGY